jgi:teichuronic acid biosynthesis glycosyltransferase TuaG
MYNYPFCCAANLRRNMGLQENKPLVTVVTAVHNSDPFLNKTIQSVTNQGFTNWEMVLVDDCSNDRSVEIIERAMETDARLKLIRLTKNSGAAVARNTAIEAANGRYMAFLDSDDLWKPEKLALQIQFMQSQDAALTYTYYERMSEAGVPLNQTVICPLKINYQQLLKSNVIGCLTAIYDSGKLGKVYMPLIRKRQDFGLWLSILKREKSAYCLPESLALYRVRTSSISSNKVDLIKYNWQLYREILDLSVPKSAFYLSCNVLKKVMP